MQLKFEKLIFFNVFAGDIHSNPSSHFEIHRYYKIGNYIKQISNQLIRLPIHSITKIIDYLYKVTYFIHH